MSDRHAVLFSVVMENNILKIINQFKIGKDARRRAENGAVYDASGRGQASSGGDDGNGETEDGTAEGTGVRLIH